jgi:hypothetical protein
VAYLEELENDGMISAADVQRIRGSYRSLLDHLKHRHQAGERLTLSDLFALQFLLEKSIKDHSASDAHMAMSSTAWNVPPLIRSLKMRFEEDPNQASLRAGRAPRSAVGSKCCQHCISQMGCDDAVCVLADLLRSIEARLARDPTVNQSDLDLESDARPPLRVDCA